MSVEEYTKQTLWPILIETVHAMIMYPNHKAYTRDVILPEKPEIAAAELATRLKMPLGEAVVILYELGEERKMKP
jgi:CTP-dependent riboflavin kinase